MIYYVVIQTERPRGSFTGQCEEGYYLLANDTVTLCDQAGTPHLDGRGKKITAKVGAGETPRQAAGRLLRANLMTLGRRSSGFNRQLSYPRQGLA
jgi:hypothetical protein